MHKQLKIQSFNMGFRNQYKTFRNFVTLEMKKAKINFLSKPKQEMEIYKQIAEKRF